MVVKGDGDVMMRILPSLLAVEYMRGGSTPQEAVQQVLHWVGTSYSLSAVEYMRGGSTLYSLQAVQQVLHGLGTCKSSGHK